MTNPRPTVTREIKLQAASRIVEDLIDSGLLDASQDRDVAASDIAASAQQYSDGYIIAKRLDDYHGWECDKQMVDVLDGFASVVGDIIRAAEKRWARDENIQPQLKSGDRIILKSWRGEEHGIIDGINEHGAAQYLVKMDGETGNTRRIVDFEKAEAAA